MDLPDKSAPQPPKKKIVPVISGAKTSSRPASRRFFDFLFAESPKDLVRKVGREVLLPRAKAGVEEAFNNFLHGMFWGTGSPPLSNMVRGTVLRGGGINYAQISSQPSALQQAQAATQNVTPGHYRDIVCPSQQTAELLLANFYETMNQYSMVAVGDLYEMANLPVEPADNAFGWFSSDGARIVQTRDGYVLQLPKPSRL